MLFGGRFGGADPIDQRRGSPPPVDVEAAVLDGGHVRSFARGPGSAVDQDDFDGLAAGLGGNGVVDLGERDHRDDLVEGERARLVHLDEPGDEDVRVAVALDDPLERQAPDLHLDEAYRQRGRGSAGTPTMPNWPCWAMQEMTAAMTGPAAVV